MEVGYQQAADTGKIREAIAKLGYAEAQVQAFGSARDVQIRL
ncbi:MAG: protein translocase subunit SecF, partial [Variovorax sp.]